ncbi:nuclear pore complex protein NUP1-like isoform X2 [Hibiscus syriacus]|uniref:nuclear pore complex protein NUP1-like isoform X2 n=1 Tax=Hibiscus syriacus TaxID=106335 RepID=UPI00192511C0|nr:nuclear pore complex protein NUP1-like isoform X2 [Hibiscus syriacus]
MATPREESNPYEGGFGAGGKFRKRPFRRTTPYDRPPTAIRNPGSSGDRNGWLSKLVDPAQRLITSSAHRLFASVFWKRLTLSPPHPPEAPESETNQEARENSPTATSTRANLECGNPSNHTDEGGVAEHEEILKHKTFTRSEIDRLMTLLHSRTVDFPGGNEDMVSKVKPVVSFDKEEKLPETPVRENGTENHLISTPVVCSTVLDEDVASPAELAKAYMGSRPQKVSVSLLRSHNQVPMADSALLNNRSFPSKSPITSLVPRSGHVGSPGNGFVTPRSWGRSAIYSMARTPYSRANSAVVHKGAGTASGAFGGPSPSSRSAWEQNRISGSSQGVLKRRSSVLDHDIGSIGPIRRIRQKSNILSTKHSISPASSNPLFMQVAGTSSTCPNALAENGDNSSPGTSFTPVPSKSSEVASKILQQLDKLVSPGEKSRTKLSPSTLNGQSLKSLENVDSSKFLGMHGSDKLSDSHMVLPDAQDSMSYNRDKAKGNGSTMLVALSDKSVPALSGIATGSLMKDNEPNGKAADSSVIKSAIQPPEQKRQGFQISANEDYLDLDDDGYPNGAASATLGKGSKSAAAAASISVEKPKVATSSLPAALLASQSTSTTKEDSVPEEPKVTSMLSFGEKVALAKESDVSTSMFRFASSNVDETSSASEPSGAKFTANSDTKLENTSSFATSVPGTTNYLADKTGKENTPTGILFRPPETAISTSVSTSMSAGSIFMFGTSKNSFTLSSGTLASSPFSYSLPTPALIPNNGQSSSSGSIKHVSCTNSDTFDAATASTTANVTTIGSTSSSPSVAASVSSSTAAPVFKFASSVYPSAAVSTLSATSREGAEAKTQDKSSGNVGPFGSNSAFTSSGSNIFGGSSAVTGTSSTSGCTAAIVTSSESSMPNDTSSNITNSGSGFFSSSTNIVTNTGSGIFGGTSANTDAGRSIFGGTSLSIASIGCSTFSTTASITSTGSNIFGFSSPATSGSTMQTQGLNTFNAVNTQAFAAGTGFGTSTQSTPIQFSSFGMAGNTSFASGSSMFGSSASVAKPFGSGATFGMSFFASEKCSLSSGSGIASGTFGSNWQAPKSPVFDSSSSSGFSFRSSASVSAPSTAPALFGLSTGASSNSIFSFTSAAVATPSQSVFGNTNPGLVFGSTPAAVATPSQNVFGNTSYGLVFGSTPSSNNDQMEDTMADDTAQASTTVPTFGQLPISPPASGSPFGASNPAGATFQFGAQPTTSHNPSPFQASSSQEFGAGGSFSLGTSDGDKSTRRFVKVRRQRKK